MDGFIRALAYFVFLCNLCRSFMQSVLSIGHENNFFNKLFHFVLNFFYFYLFRQANAVALEKGSQVEAMDGKQPKRQQEMINLVETHLIQ